MKINEILELYDTGHLNQTQTNFKNNKMLKTSHKGFYDSYYPSNSGKKVI